MDCTCEFELDETSGEFVVGFREKKTAAKDALTCDECEKVIITGEEYILREFDVVADENEDGSYVTKEEKSETCLDCASIGETFFPYGYFAGNLFDDIRDGLEEVEGKIPSDCISSLSPRARGMVCDIWQEVLDGRAAE